MSEFCGCEKPSLETTESGMSVVVRCLNCGQSAVTTNTKKIEESNPWINDDTKYQIIISPVGLDRATFFKVMKKKLSLSNKFANELYLDRRDSVAFQGKGQEFYEFCEFLKEMGVPFETRPKCSYV